MLCIDPRDRYSVTDCLAHPYVKLWHKPHEVNRCESPKYYDEQLEMQEKTVEEWKGAPLHRHSKTGIQDSFST